MCYIFTKLLPHSSIVIFYIFFLRRHYEWDSTALLAEEPKRKRKFVTTASHSSLGGRRTHQKRAQTVAKQLWCPSHKQNTLWYSYSSRRRLLSEARASWDSFFFDKNGWKFRTNLIQVETFLCYIFDVFENVFLK